MDEEDESLSYVILWEDEFDYSGLEGTLFHNLTHSQSRQIKYTS